jgi:hypothetical protein
MSPGPSCFDRAARCAFAAAGLLAGFGAAAVWADDRDLLRLATAEPYLFVVLDTSGSMNWTPSGPDCPTGDCYAPLQADDPTSKFYQAKQALYEVLTDPSFPGLQLGFATYNQDSLGVEVKHWLYEAASAGPTIAGWGPYPAVGDQDVFGQTWGCDTGDGTNDEIGCYSDSPADLTDSWERARVQRLSKGGRTFTVTLPDFFVRHSGTTWRVRYAPASGAYGSDLTMTVSVWRCNNSSCSSTTPASGSPATVTFRPVRRSDGLTGSDFLSWDNGENRTAPNLGYFPQGTVSDSSAGNTCAGWDPNTPPENSGSDPANNYNLRFPTDTSDPRNSSFDVGDVVPLDWRTDHKADILRRLAPNYPLTGTPPAGFEPDFRIATYFSDNRSGGDSFLRLEDTARRPLLANGSTPIISSIRNFRTWYNGCAPTGNCAGNGGWVATAANPDPAIGDAAFRCRQKYLLILTDGDETCITSQACSTASSLVARLRSEGVTTFVVAFGVQNTSGNVLSCMGDADHVFFPQNKDELVEALQKAIGSISEDPRAFASAAVPSVQAEVADRIYLSSFRPIGDDATDPLVTPWIWDGHLDAYLKPLPLKDGRPDRTRICPPVGGTQPRTSCFLWDAGEVLVSQSPDRVALNAAPTLDEATLKLGINLDQRRVFYTKANTGSGTPSTLRLLAPPVGDPKTDPLWSDLWTGFKLPAPVTDPDFADTKTRINTIIKNTLMIKKAKIQQTGLPTLNIEYVMGDIFHADPAIVDRPSDFSFYSSNVNGNKGINSDCVNDTGYRCYAKKHDRRRKLLLVGANDGQLHAFDAGVWDPSRSVFTEGTGKEVFSYMPRMTMPIVRNQTEGPRQIFSVDATPRVDDVFIDPAHNGTPDSSEREWRTVAVGGFREGGSRDGGGRVSDFFSGYYALDITQPDQLDSANDPIDMRVVPSCLSLQNQTVSGCGTLPYPAVLWEFTDSLGGSRLDEDLNSAPDLGQTWSVPTIGRIRVVDNGVVADKWVAIVGGGMDAANKVSPKSGNWLYMLDIETGRAIYKRALVGAATADPAVLDADLDGYLDTIYIGTTGGFLYKVDISSPGIIQDVVLDKAKFLPALAADLQVRRINDAAWDPFPVFDTAGKPIYLPVTAFFAAQLGNFALAFGTGDREALWDPNTQEGRFYLIVDDGFTAADVASGILPHDDLDYQEIPVGSADAPDGTNFVLTPGNGLQKGWYITLPENERVITQTFGLAGVVIFSGFEPDAASPDRPCARGGASHIFVVYADNGNGVMESAGVPIRFRTVGNFVTNPYVEQGSTKNPPTSGGPTPNSEDLDVIQKGIMDSLKRFFPECAKFANYWISVSGSRDDTQYERYATIPIGICERNWKEH